MKNNACCVTGHRDIPADKHDYVRQELRREILEAIENGYTHFISGFAEGVDLSFAAIVAELKQKNKSLTLEAAIPYRNRLKTPDTLFQQLIGQCDIICVHSETYWPGCFMKRNRNMVFPSQRVIAVYDGRGKGGTFGTMKYAYSLEKEVRPVNI